MIMKYKYILKLKKWSRELSKIIDMVLVMTE